MPVFFQGRFCHRSEWFARSKGSARSPRYQRWAWCSRASRISGRAGEGGVSEVFACVDATLNVFDLSWQSDLWCVSLSGLHRCSWGERGQRSQWREGKRWFPGECTLLLALTDNRTSLFLFNFTIKLWFCYLREVKEIQENKDRMGSRWETNSY